MIRCGCGQCPQEAKHSIQWQTPAMRGPAFWPSCDLHLDEDLSYFQRKHDVIFQVREIEHEKTA